MLIATESIAILSSFADIFDDFTNFLNLWFGEMRTGNNEGVINMTYRLENFIEKITTPIICVFDGKEVEYADGKDLTSRSFERYWLVDSINVTDGKLVLKMKENKNTNTIDWIGEEGVVRSFF